MTKKGQKNEEPIRPDKNTNTRGYEYRYKGKD
jgi:hypothetical protein